MSAPSKLTEREIGAVYRHSRTHGRWNVTDVFEKNGVVHVGLLSTTGIRRTMTADAFEQEFEGRRPPEPPEPIAPPPDF